MTPLSPYFLLTRRMKRCKKMMPVSPTSPRTPTNLAAIGDDASGDSTPSCHMSQRYLPSGDSPYVRAKHAQLVEKDLNKAVRLFWAAINCGDRVDSALKDMASVMKQVDRAEEAIEAIKSFRSRCSFQAQEALDNVLLDLYKKCGMMHEEIELLNSKLKQVEEGPAFGGRARKLARSQGKRIHMCLNKEKSRLLGNLAWAHMQLGNYVEAEPIYRKALAIELDYNKQCNLAICLLRMGRLAEARYILADVKKPYSSGSSESYLKSFERANEILEELETEAVPLSKSAEIKLEPQSTPISNHMRNVGCSNFNAKFGMKYEGFSEEKKSSCSELSNGYSSSLSFRSRISNSFREEGLPKCATSQSKNGKRIWVHNPYRQGESNGTCKRKLMYYAQEDFPSPVSIHGNQRVYSRESSTVSRPHADGGSSGSLRNNRYMKFEKPMEYLIADNSAKSNVLIQSQSPENNTAIANRSFDPRSEYTTELSRRKALDGTRDTISETDKKELPRRVSSVPEPITNCTNSPADNGILFAYMDESSMLQKVDVLTNCDSHSGEKTRGDKIVQEENLAHGGSSYDAAADQKKKSSKELMEKFRTATVSDGKRTWADMVEEEEEEEKELFANENLENGDAFNCKHLSYQYSKENGSESFQDENIDSNIMKSTAKWAKKKPQSYIESVRQKLSKIDLNEGSDIVLRTPRRARRSLSFREQPIFDVSCNHSSPIGAKDTSGGPNYMAGINNWSKSGFGSGSGRTRSRLRVFQEITHDINTKG